MIGKLLLIILILATQASPHRPPTASRLLVVSILKIIDEPLTHDSSKIKAIKCICQAWMQVHAKQEGRVK